MMCSQVHEYGLGRACAVDAGEILPSGISMSCSISALNLPNFHHSDFSVDIPYCQSLTLLSDGAQISTLISSRFAKNDKEI